MSSTLTVTTAFSPAHNTLHVACYDPATRELRYTALAYAFAFPEDQERRGWSAPDTLVRGVLVEQVALGLDAGLRPHLVYTYLNDEGSREIAWTWRTRDGTWAPTIYLRALGQSILAASAPTFGAPGFHLAYWAATTAGMELWYLVANTYPDGRPGTCERTQIPPTILPAPHGPAPLSFTLTLDQAGRPHITYLGRAGLMHVFVTHQPPAEEYTWQAEVVP